MTQLVGYVGRVRSLVHVPASRTPGTVRLTDHARCLHFTSRTPATRGVVSPTRRNPRGLLLLLPTRRNLVLAGDLRVPTPSSSARASPVLVSRTRYLQYEARGARSNPSSWSNQPGVRPGLRTSCLVEPGSSWSNPCRTWAGYLGYLEPTVGPWSSWSNPCRTWAGYLGYLRTYCRPIEIWR